MAMLEDTGLQSPRLIWEAMESKPSSLAGEHGSTRTSPTETEESALPAANSANPPAETEPKVSGTMSEAAPVES